MIRVLLIEDVRSTGEMVSSVVNEQTDMILLGTCTTAKQATSRLESADVVLVDTQLARDSAYRLTRMIAGAGFRARVLVIGSSESKKAILRYIEAGARGYFRRSDRTEELPDMIRRASQGEVILSPDMMAEVVSRLAEITRNLEGASQFSNRLTCLTPREREVLQLIGYNYSNRDIANHLIIELGTVKNHVHNILSKLNVGTRREAARFLLSTRGYFGESRNQQIRAWSTPQNAVPGSG